MLLRRARVPAVLFVRNARNVTAIFLPANVTDCDVLPNWPFDGRACPQKSHPTEIKPMKRISLAASVAAIFLMAGQSFAQSGAMNPPAADQNAMSQPSSHMSSGHMSSGQMSSNQMSSGMMHKSANPADKTKHAGGMSRPGSASAAGKSTSSSDSMSNPH